MADSPKWSKQLLEKSDTSNIDALKQLEAAIALAKTELSNASKGSTGRDAAADKLSDLEKQREELLDAKNTTRRSSNKELIRVQKALALAKKDLHAARSKRSKAKAAAKLKKLKAEKKKIMRLRAKERAAAKEAKEDAEMAPMEGKAEARPDESESKTEASADASASSADTDTDTDASAVNAPMKYIRKAPYEMEFLHPIDSHATGTPEKDDCVLVHYSAKVSPEWTLIDSSFARHAPITFTVGSPDIIEGWDYAVKQLGVGQSARFQVPAELAYPQGFPPVVRKDSVIEYELQLLSISKPKAKI